MNLFVHARIGHFLMEEHDDEGGDLGGLDHLEEDEEQEDHQEEQDDDQQGSDEGEQDEGEVVVTLGGKALGDEDDDRQPAPDWVKALRQENREKNKRIRELEAAAAAREPAAQPAPQLGKKPTMEDADWDEEKFEQALTDWHDRKRQVEQHEANQRTEKQRQQEEWQGRLNTYETAKVALKAKVKDYDDAEEAVKGLFDVTQQSIIVTGANDPAMVVYALGKNPAEAKRLAAIKDPIKYAFAIANLESKLKMSTRKAPPPPEGKVNGSGRTSGTVDSQLERLRKEAEKTGDNSKVDAYKRAQRQKASKSR